MLKMMGGDPAGHEPHQADREQHANRLASGHVTGSAAAKM
jgi:hypothetical protein